MSGPVTDVRNIIGRERRTPTVSFPGATPEEREIQRLQLDVLRRQARDLEEMDLLSGMALQRSGLRERRDAQGKLIGFEEIPEAELSPEQREQRQIEQLFRQRSLAALRGELPVDPALTRGLAEDRQALEARLLRDLGPGFRTSTPGMEALATSDQRKAEILEAARRGDLTLAEQLGQARQASNFGATQQSVGQLFAPFSPQFAAGGQVVSTANVPLSQLFQNRAGAYNAALESARMKFQRRNLLISERGAGFRQDMATFGQIFGGA